MTELLVMVSSATPPTMRGRVTIRQFIVAIKKLPSDRQVVNPKKWYRTQKQHWLGWLGDYNGRGAYGRIPGKNRDARFAYNHVVEPKMLLWLIAAAGVSADAVRAAQRVASRLESMHSQAAAVRQHVSWDDVAEALWSRKSVPKSTKSSLK